MNISIWIGNLGKYNEGYLVGEWVSLPHNDGDFSDVFARIGISDEPDEYGCYYEEWFVADIDMDYPIFEYREYPNLEEWNDIAEEVSCLDEENLEMAKAAIEAGWYSTDEFLEAAEDSKDWIVYDANLRNNGELASEYIYMIGGASQLGESILNNYFDYRTFGQDHRFMYGSDDPIVSRSNDDTDIGWNVVEEYYGGIEYVDDDTKEQYFDNVKFGNYLVCEGNFTSFGEYGNKTLEKTN